MNEGKKDKPAYQAGYFVAQTLLRYLRSLLPAWGVDALESQPEPPPEPPPKPPPEPHFELSDPEEPFFPDCANCDCEDCVHAMGGVPPVQVVAMGMVPRHPWEVN